MNTGFLLLRIPQVVAAAWPPVGLPDRARMAVNTIRAAFPEWSPNRYRGIQRAAFNEDQEEPEYSAALRLLADALGPIDTEAMLPRFLIPTLELARNVCALLPDPSNWELVSVSTADYEPGEFLGYDVGYWGGGDFSILADAVVMPHWHPPPIIVFPKLAALLECLNTQLLFPTRDSAEAYRQFYSSEPWAELDAGAEFVVQRVTKVLPGQAAA